MRFLVDVCTGSSVAKWLKEKGHEVCSVYDECRGATDDEVLEKAYSENWIIITNDKDFGEKIYKENRIHQGVIFLRLDGQRPAPKGSGLVRASPVDPPPEAEGNFGGGNVGRE